MSFDWSTHGGAIARVSAYATVVFVVTAVLAAVSPSTFRGPAIAVALVLFAVGILVFFSSYFVAIGRSRYDELSVAGVYFMTGGVAPRPVRTTLLGLTSVQTVVAIATAAARPYTSLAFGILVPLFGLAMVGLWSARHGAFPPRRTDDTADHRADSALTDGDEIG